MMKNFCNRIENGYMVKMYDEGKACFSSFRWVFFKGENCEWSLFILGGNTHACFSSEKDIARMEDMDGFYVITAAIFSRLKHSG